MRSKLFVPGVRPELFAKALAGDADALSFDLEDSVPEKHKDGARSNVAGFVRSQPVRDAAKVLKGNGGHYLFISTISVYADGSRPGIDETAPLAAYKGRGAMAETQQTLMADIEGLYGPLKALSEA